MCSSRYFAERVKRSKNPIAYLTRTTQIARSQILLNRYGPAVIVSGSVNPQINHFEFYLTWVSIRLLKANLDLYYHLEVGLLDCWAFVTCRYLVGYFRMLLVLERTGEQLSQEVCIIRQCCLAYEFVGHRSIPNIRISPDGLKKRKNRDEKKREGKKGSFDCQRPGPRMGVYQYQPIPSSKSSRSRSIPDGRKPISIARRESIS
jgi:hypothetical protein